MSSKILGIDVSAHQANIDWIKVKNSGVDFAVIKATQGKDSKYPQGFVDSYFEKNYVGAKAAGIKVGAYHFAVFVTEAQAKEEAQYYMSALKGKQFDYPICLDLEDLPVGRSPIISNILTKTQLTNYAVIFLEELKKAGYTPMFYTNTDWRKNKLDYTKLSGYLLWQAHYPFGYSYQTMDTLYNNKPAAIDGKVSIWQCTGVGKVGGITGNVDMNWGFADLNINKSQIPETPKTPNPPVISEVPKIPKTGDSLGDVLYSDIKAYINGYEIPSSVADDKTLVIAEELVNYGFDVVWNGANRILKVERNKNKSFKPLPGEKIPDGKKSGDFKCKYVYTDIKTYIGGEEVPAYNIGGMTLIDVELLSKYGSVVWNGETRELRVKID